MSDRPYDVMNVAREGTTKIELAWINRFANGRNLPYKCMVLDEAYKDVFTSKCKDCSNNITWVPGDSEELVDNKYNNLLRDLLELRDGVVNTMVRSPYPPRST